MLTLTLSLSKGEGGHPHFFSNLLAAQGLAQKGTSAAKCGRGFIDRARCDTYFAVADC